MAVKYVDLGACILLLSPLPLEASILMGNAKAGHRGHGSGVSFLRPQQRTFGDDPPLSGPSCQVPYRLNGIAWGERK